MWRSYESITPFATQISNIGEQPTGTDIDGNGQEGSEIGEDKRTVKQGQFSVEGTDPYHPFLANLSAKRQQRLNKAAKGLQIISAVGKWRWPNSFRQQLRCFI